MIESHRVVVASLMAVSFAALAFLLVAIDWAAASGRLKRNRWAGIRTTSTMRSDRAWVAGHRAALRLTPLHVLTGVGLILVALGARNLAVANFVGIGGAVVFVVVVAVTGIVAGRAAKAADRDTDK